MVSASGVGKAWCLVTLVRERSACHAAPPRPAWILRPGDRSPCSSQQAASCKRQRLELLLAPDRPEVVRQTAVCDVLVRHREIPAHPPPGPPRVADEEPLFHVVVA